MPSTLVKLDGSALGRIALFKDTDNLADNVFAQLASVKVVFRQLLRLELLLHQHQLILAEPFNCHSSLRHIDRAHSEPRSALK